MAGQPAVAAEKSVIEHTELERKATVQPMPETLKREAGLVLDTEGLTDGNSVRLAPDGHTVLLPQPTDDPNDPLNWSWFTKHAILFTVAWGALCADFTSAAGTAVIFYQAAEWEITPNKANYPGNINVLMMGLGGLLWVPMVSFWGRAPVLFWTTFIGILFTIGSALSTEYSTFFAMRALTGWFVTAAQTISIAFLKDIFFFHERARKIGLWALLYIASPYLGPCLANFVVASTGHWPDVFWLCTGVLALQLVFIVAFIDETWYNRNKNSSSQPTRKASFGGRMLRLIGVSQLQHHSTYYMTVGDAFKKFGLVITKPAFFFIVFSYFLVFAWAIGINITTAILFATPAEYGGYGFSNKGLGFLYFIPIGGVFLGEVFGHFFNDWLARRYIHQHKGIFEPECRLWTIYISMFFIVPALVLVGQSLQHHLPVVAIVFGWGGFTFGVMTMSVAVTAYSLDAYPTTPGEIAGWINFARVAGGFSVAFYQSPWAEKVGADVSFGTQAAIVSVAILPVILVHRFGHGWRS